MAPIDWQADLDERIAEACGETHKMTDTKALRTGSILEFWGGSVEIKRSGYPNNGDGALTFNDDDLEWEHCVDREGSYRSINIKKSELVSIRDFLNRELPPVPDREHVLELRAALQSMVEAHYHILFNVTGERQYDACREAERILEKTVASSEAE